MIRINKHAAPVILYKTGQKQGVNRVVEATNILNQFYDTHRAGINRGSRKVTFRRAIYAHKSIKSKLKIVQHGKCVFCESKFAKVSYGDVEHFRPKAAYQLSPGGLLIYPGYYWLAYEWDNLFYSCQICNQQHKKNLFPLHDENTRSLDRQVGVAGEVAVLVHPGSEDPQAFIGFTEDVAVGLDNDDRGIDNISYLGLNRVQLLEARRTAINIYLSLLEIVKSPVNSQEVKDAALGVLLQHTNTSRQSDAEYSAMFQNFYDQELAVFV